MDPSQEQHSVNYTATAKMTETPRKLKDHQQQQLLQIDTRRHEASNNNEEEENESERRVGVRRPLSIKAGDTWASRAGFSPRPKRQNNPARRPILSVTSIRAVDEDAEDEDEAKQDDQDQDKQPTKSTTSTIAKKTDSFRQSNQLERIQEDDMTDDSDSDDAYDGDEEEGDVALQLYKSLSEDPLDGRFDATGPRLQSLKRPTHRAYDDEDDDVVCM